MAHLGSYSSRPRITWSERYVCGQSDCNIDTLRVELDCSTDFHHPMLIIGYLNYPEKRQLNKSHSCSFHGTVYIFFVKVMCSAFQPFMFSVDLPSENLLKLSVPPDVYGRESMENSGPHE